jgi:hypothetical protein
MNRLTNEDVAESVSMTTLRMHQLVTDFYEDMHTDSGEAVTDITKTLSLLQSFRRSIAEELTMVHEAVVQYLEDHGQ